MIDAPTTSRSPDHLGRDLTSVCVGISINELQSSYYGAMVDGAVLYLRERGINAIVHLNAHLRTGELEAWDLVRSKRFDSWIIYSDQMTDDELAELMGDCANVVLMNRRIAGFEDRCVSTDCDAGGVLAARHLLEYGHTELAMVAGPRTLTEVQLRSNGFTQTIKNWQSDVPAPLVLESDFTELGGALAIEEIIDHPRNISATFFQNDGMAIGALEYCHENKIQVPQNMSIIGFDGLKIGRYVSPKLSSIRQPLRLIGRESARIATTLIDPGINSDEALVKRTYFEPTLIEGDSVRRLSKLNPMIRLTRREKECLEWTAHGKTAGEVAEILQISIRTVNNHLSNSFKRLNVTNRSEAIAKSIRDGLIDL